MATPVVGKVVFGKSEKYYPELIKAQKRIKELEVLLASEIKEVSKLLKENTNLESELEKTRHQRNVWRRYYEELKGEPKIQCDRSKAMVIHGEIDISEVLHND